MSNKVAELDFLIVGAQKSGTTTLFQLLREHPQIYMPLQKEVGFFSNPKDDRYVLGFTSYLNQYFADANTDQVLGEASPQYMCCLYAAKRIAHDAPSVKLIAVLRNPVDRCYSAYKMLLRFEEEQRAFGEILNDIDMQATGRQIDKQEYFSRTDVIRPGLYGAILGSYLQYFSREQIHICFMEDLESNPAKVIHDIYLFLGVDENFIPPSTNKKLHAGGKVKSKSIVRMLTLVRKIKPYLPSIIMKRIAGRGYWLQQWNIKPEHDMLETQAMRKRLVKYYLPDIELLKEQFSIDVPWKEFN